MTRDDDHTEADVIFEDMAKIDEERFRSKVRSRLVLPVIGMGVALAAQSLRDIFVLKSILPTLTANIVSSAKFAFGLSVYRSFLDILGKLLSSNAPDTIINGRSYNEFIAERAQNFSQSQNEGSVREVSERYRNSLNTERLSAQTHQPARNF